MEHGPWLRQQREVRGWSRREMARRLIQVGEAAGAFHMPDIDCVYGYVRRWEHGGSLTERYRLYYCAALGIPPGQFGTAPPKPAPAAPALADPRLSASVAVAYRGEYASDLGASMVEREVLMTAHESSDHAEQPGLGENTLEQLRADVTRLAWLINAGEPLTAFLDMRQVRDRIYRLLDHRLAARDQRDLYFLLGCLHELMGTAASALGYVDAAEELIRAGLAYASAIDHRPLQGHLRKELAQYARWRGRWQESRDLAATGLEYLREGPGAANLHLRYAWAAARLGDDDAARGAVADAHEAREQDYTDDLLEIGGEFALSLATHHMQAGTVLASVEGSQREAAAELERAIELYDDGPRPGEQHWFAGKPLAGIDLALVRLRSGALDAAAEALEPALTLPPSQRIIDVTTQFTLVRQELTASIFRGSAQARTLGEQIEDFGREAIVGGLHSLPGGQG